MAALLHSGSAAMTRGGGLTKMARIVVAVDERGRRFKVTEEQADKRGLKVVGKTASDTSARTKKATTPRKKA